MSDLFKFVLVESGKSTYTALETKAANTMYAIPAAKELYFEDQLIASSDVIFVTELPEIGLEKKIYVVTEGENKGLYAFEGETAVSLLSAKDIVTLTGIQTLINKTIDANSNTITNISTTNMTSSAISTEVANTDDASDTKLVTEKAVRTELDTKVTAVDGKSLVDDEEIEKLAGVEEGANKYTHPELASTVTAGTAYNKVEFDETGHVSKATSESTLAGLGISDAYTKEETDSKIASIVESLIWKDAVDTYADIATTYPEPEEGWTVSVKDTNIVYRYDEETSSWINAFQSLANLVEASTNGEGGHAGIMSAGQAEKLAGIEEGAEVNANGYGKVKIGDATLVSKAANDTLEIKSGKNVTVSVDEDEDGNKSLVISAADYTHPSLADGVTADKSYNKVAFDANGHVSSASAETTVKGLGVTAEADDVTAMTGYTKATEKAAIEATDSLNTAIGKLEYLAEKAESDASNKVAKTSIATALSSESTDTEVASAKVVYDSLKVVRI